MAPKIVWAEGGDQGEVVFLAKQKFSKPVETLAGGERLLLFITHYIHRVANANADLDPRAGGANGAGVGDVSLTLRVDVVGVTVRVVVRAVGAVSVDLTGAVLTVDVEEVGVVRELRLEISAAGDELVNAKGLVDGRLCEGEGDISMRRGNGIRQGRRRKKGGEREP